MICTTTAQMNRVALAGASKMTAQGYTYEATEGVPGWYTVALPADRTKTGTEVRYHINLLSDRAQDCTCKFWEANRHLQGATCKHCCFVRWEEASIAEYEAFETARAEEAEYQQFNESRAEWQTFTPCHLPQGVAA